MKISWKKLMDKLKMIEPLLRFFEVCLIAVATIIVSINANSISKQSNAISEMQLSATKEANQPNFVISQVREADSQDKESTTAILRIYNTAGNFSSIDIDTACFIKFVHFSDSLESTEQLFSLRGFYFKREWIKQPSDLLCNIFYDGNWSKFSNLYVEVLNNGYDYIDLQQYVRISYTDIYDEYHTNYYIIDSISQSQISISEGERIFNLYDELNQVDIDNLSLSVLLEGLTP